MKTNHYIYSLRVIAATLMLLSISTIFARQLSPEEAFAKISTAGPGNSTGQIGLKSLDWKKVRVLDTRRSGDFNAVYVMTAPDDGKVMIVSADDVARPLLGWFNASPDLDVTNLPPSLEWWLDMYAKEITTAVNAGADTYDVSTTTSTLTNVAPLIATHWNQSAPYNMKCPTIDGRATYTGCVATAMAQLVNYHRWPVRCSGSVKYYAKTIGDTLRLDLSTFSPDWDNLTPTYGSTSSDEQKLAVAELMKACGYASKMNYGTAASGAMDMNMLTGLIDNFGYAKSIEMLARECYPLNEWIGILHNELVNHRPVYYSGHDTGGHAFIVDGFRSPDYFHINWGWGGMSDGYFVITALDPSSQGIGGSSSGYNFDQSATIGIQKDYPGSVSPVSMHLTGSFNTSTATYSENENVSFLGSQSYIYNSGYSDIPSMWAGVRLINEESGDSILLFENNGGYTLPAGYAISSYKIPFAKFPSSGQYRVEPIVRTDNELISLRTPIGACKSLHLEASGSSLSFSAIDPVVSIKVADLKATGRVYEGMTITLEGTIEGIEGEYYSTVTPKIYRGTSLVAEGGAMLVDIPQGTSRSVRWTVDLGALTAGQYQAYIADDNGNNIGGPLGFEVLATPEGDPELSLTSVLCNASSGDGTWRTPWIVPTDHLTLTTTFTNSRGLYNNYIYVAIFPSAGGMSLASVRSGDYVLGPDERAEWLVDSDLGTLEEGATYFLRFYYMKNSASQSFGDYYYITTSGFSAIDNVVAEHYSIVVDRVTSSVAVHDPSAAVASITAYSPTGIVLGSASGHPVCGSSLTLTLPRGIVLLRVSLANGGSEVRKIVIQ